MSLNTFKNKAVIYKLKCPNGRTYIGKAINFYKRMLDYARGKTKGQPNVHNCILKYGWDNFTKEVIEEVEDITKLDEREIYWIDYYKTNKNKYPEVNGLNLTDGGIGSKGHKQNDSSLIKRKQNSKPREIGGSWVINLDTGIYYESITTAARAHNLKTPNIHKWTLGTHNPKRPIFKIENADVMLGKWLNGDFKPKPRTRSEEQRKKQSERRLGKKASQETRSKMSARMIEDFRNGKRIIRKGHKHSKEHIEKIRIHLIGRGVTEETRRKLSISNSKTILLDINNGIYYTFSEACETFKINKGTLYDQLKDKTKKKSTNLIIV